MGIPDLDAIMAEGVAEWESSQPESPDTPADEAEAVEAGSDDSQPDDSQPVVDSQEAPEPVEAEAEEAKEAKDEQTPEADESAEPPAKPRAVWTAVSGDKPFELPPDLKLTFTANGKEVTKDVNGLVRAGQQLPAMQQRVESLLAQRTQLDQELLRAGQVEQEYRESKKFWQYVMSDATGERFFEAQRAFQEGMGEQAPAKEEPAAAPQPTDEQQGQAFMTQYVEPWIEQTAAAFSITGAEPSYRDARFLEGEIRNAFLQYVAQEGRHLTPERLSAIIQEDIPALIAEAGYRPVAAASGANSMGTHKPAAPDEVAALRAENAKLKRRVKADKLEKAPDAGGTGAGTPGARGLGARVDKAMTWADIKEQLNDPNETFGL